MVSRWPMYREQRRLAVWNLPSTQVVWPPADLKAKWPAIIFAHQLKNSSGESRIVMVSVVEWRDGNAIADFHPVSERCISLLDLIAPSQIPQPSGFNLTGTLPSEGSKLFAGQPDLADDSHFTIDYEVKDQRGTIDGWLMPDNSVKIEPRDGPLKR